MSPVSPGGRPLESDRAVARWVYICGWLATMTVLARITFAFYPMVGHDYSLSVPAMREIGEAWARAHVVDFDFSPFRCLGLPVYANPNSITFSLFHLSAYLFREVPGIYATACLFLSVGYLGAVRFGRVLGFPPALSMLLGLGWCLQGFCISHGMVGHTNYLQLALWPLFLHLLLEPRPSWVSRIALAFWLAHLLYTSGYYLLLMGVPSLLVAALLLHGFVGSRLRAAGLGGPREVLENLARVAPWVALMTLPKVLAVFNFMAKYPRLVHLDRVSPIGALVYTLGNLFYPLPWDVHAYLGWDALNWESYQFFLPGFFFWLVYLVVRHRRELPAGRFALAFGAIVLCGALVSSGLLGPVFERLPLFKSLHVNPRWNALVLLPLYALSLCVLMRLGYAGRGEGRARAVPPVGLVLAMAAFTLVPLLYLDRDNMALTYRDGAGIDPVRGRLSYCYEPIFGFKLENFPLGSSANWLGGGLIDPRCYLASYECPAGRPFVPGPSGAVDRDLLARYRLVDEYPPVRWLKLPALALYAFAGLVAMLSLGGLLLALARDDVGRDRSGPRTPA